MKTSATPILNLKSTRSIINPDGSATIFFRRPKCDGKRNCPNKTAFAIRQKRLLRRKEPRTLYYCCKCAPSWASSGNTLFYDVNPISGEAK